MVGGTEASSRANRRAEKEGDRKMISSAEKQRAYRERRDAGRCVLSVEANEVDLAELLISAGLLSRDLEDNRAAIEAATAKLLQLIAGEHGDQLERLLPVTPPLPTDR